MSIAWRTRTPGSSRSWTASGEIAIPRGVAMLRSAAAPIARARKTADRAVDRCAAALQVEVDHRSQSVYFYGAFSGAVTYCAMTFGGSGTLLHVRFDRREDYVIVVAPGVVERFDLRPYLLEWEAQCGQAARDNQGLHVSRAIAKNVGNPASERF